MKKFICCVAALSALIFSSGCGDDEKQVEPVDEYWIEWKNESDYRIDFFYGEFYQFNLSSCIRQQNSLTAQFVSFSLSNLANIFYPPQFLQ